ncbi:unnamed protein product [Spirodela intermedia]|uniref:GATA-type domain-containing protein n=1 Tax=Spirodela intermedia TaxID=51605 RepID=A0A7I8J711_SPIIN|nr:unnamed protein product [Spirodela intermedia]CAA6666038.1 unnamed protein product [Spirodela intermedia]
MEQQGRPSETFVVEDLLDFSLEDCGCEEAPVSSAEDSAIISLGGSFNSPHGGETYFSGNSPACDELAELEWLSNFVEESFHTDDLQRLQLTFPFQPVILVLGAIRCRRTRTKRRRLPPLSSWSSYRPVISPNASSSSPLYETSSPASSSSTARKAPTAKRKMEQYVPEGQKCLHCAATKTPQWRAGPMGPKTLCNACGVRYKSGKLAPEYRPVASPTFLPSQHSNSHRKVLELRQRKGLTAASLSPEF